MKDGLKSMMNSFLNEKNFDSEKVYDVIENTLISAYKKKFGKGLNNGIVKFDVKNDSYGLFAIKDVVDNDDLYSPLTEIEIKDALLLNSDIKVGERMPVEIDIDNFSRAEVQVAKNRMMTDTKEVHNNNVLSEFQNKKGLISGNLLKEHPNGNLSVELKKGIEAILPKKNQSPTDSFNVGSRIKFLIESIDKKENRVHITLTRASKEFVEELLKEAVNELSTGAIKIFKSVRVPGQRTKIAVYSDRTDISEPVKICLGDRAINIQNIKTELNGEFIDIVKYSKDIKEFIKNALTPAKTEQVQIIDESKKTAIVIVADSELMHAIGKKGINIRLANRLLDWNVDVKNRESVNINSGLLFNPEEKIITSVYELPNVSQDLLEILVKNKIEDLSNLVSMSDADIQKLEGMNKFLFENLKNILSELNIEKNSQQEVKEPLEEDSIDTNQGSEEKVAYEDSEDDEADIEFIEDLPFSQDIISKLKSLGFDKIVDIIDAQDLMKQKGLSDLEIEEINKVLDENIDFSDE